MAITLPDGKNTPNWTNPETGEKWVWDNTHSIWKNREMVYKTGDTMYGDLKDSDTQIKGGILSAEPQGEMGPPSDDNQIILVERSIFPGKEKYGFTAVGYTSFEKGYNVSRVYIAAVGEVYQSNPTNHGLYYSRDTHTWLHAGRPSEYPAAYDELNQPHNVFRLDDNTMVISGNSKRTEDGSYVWVAPPNEDVVNLKWLEPGYGSFGQVRRGAIGLVNRNVLYAAGGKEKNQDTQRATVWRGTVDYWETQQTNRISWGNSLRTNAFGHDAVCVGPQPWAAEADGGEGFLISADGGQMFRNTIVGAERYMSGGNGPLGSVTIKAMAFGPGVGEADTVIAVGENGEFTRSLDGGETWSAYQCRLSPGNNPGGVVTRIKHLPEAENSWVAMGTNGLVAFSSDGETWAMSVDASRNKVMDVTYGDGYFVFATKKSVYAFEYHFAGPRKMYWNGSQVLVDDGSYDAVTSSVVSVSAENGRVKTITRDSNLDQSDYEEGTLWYKSSTNTLHVKDSDNWVALFQ